MSLPLTGAGHSKLISDAVAPTVTLVEVQTGLTVDVTFSEAMGDGVTTASNYAVSGTGKGALSTNPTSVALVSDTKYRCTWATGEMFNGGNITITVTGAKDLAGNEINSNGTDTGGAIGTAPPVVITCVQSSPTTTTPLNFIATFSEEVTGFASGDITPGGVGGAVANFATADNIVFTFDSAPSGAGAVTMDIGAGVCTDLAGNPNTAASQLSITYVPKYSAILVAAGADEVWVPSDIASGTVIPAKVNVARNGVQTGWALQNAAGLVPGTLAPYSDKVNDVGNIYTSGGGVGLADIFDGAIGSVLLLYCNDADWTGNQTLLELRADANNRLTIASAAATLYFYYNAGGTAKFVTKPMTGITGWHSYGLAWNKTANQAWGVFDGIQVQATMTGLGVWVGALNAAYCVIGAEDTSKSKCVVGWLDYMAINVDAAWSVADYLAMHNAAATAGAG